MAIWLLADSEGMAMNYWHFDTSIKTDMGMEEERLSSVANNQISEGQNGYD